MVLEKVSKLLSDYKDIEEESITNETTLEELGLDSLDTVELIMQLEEEFSVTIEANEDIETVGDLVGLINGLVK